MKYFSTFSGIGGFELGIGKKAECVGYSEIDKYATEIYEKHFNHKAYGDITKINEKRLPDFDLLCGGFPCQSFSIAGKRGGFEDTRGTLFFDIARITKYKRPRLLFFENVKGLLSHDEGRTFNTIILTLDELGYDIQWQVLNSKNHGVPQNRERVFIIGHLRGTSRPKVFPFGETNGEDTKIQYVTKSDKKDFRTFSEKGIAPSLQARSDTHKLQQPKQLIVKKVIGKVKVRKHIVNIELLKQLLRAHKKPIKEISEKLKVKKTTVEHWFRKDNCFSIPEAEIWFELKDFLGIKTVEFDKAITEFEIRDNKFDMANRVYQKEGLSPTLTTLTGGHQHSIIDDGYSIRRLTPTECERLQGFPNGWTEGLSDTQRYKTLGNAVTVNVVKDIMEKLL